ncbi:MAG: mechanosensitive ion channel family protein [Bacteroidota bacterium]
MFDNTITETIHKLLDKLTSWFETLVLMLPNFLVAVIVLLLFVFVSKIVNRISQNILDRVTPERTSLSQLGATVIRITIIALGLFVSLSILHLDQAVSSLLAGAGIIGLALGFAFQDITANFLSGIFIATRRPFQIGDMIETNDFMGKVESIKLRATVIRSLDGQEIIIPNKDIYQNAMRIFTTGARRIRLSVGVGYESNLREVKRITRDAISTLDMLSEGKDVQVFFKEFGDSSINLEVFYWIRFHLSSDQAKYMEAVSEGIIAIKEAYDQADINIPFPIRTLDIADHHVNVSRDQLPIFALQKQST